MVSPKLPVLFTWSPLNWPDTITRASSSFSFFISRVMSVDSVLVLLYTGVTLGCSFMVFNVSCVLGFDTFVVAGDFFAVDMLGVVGDL